MPPEVIPLDQHEDKVAAAYGQDGANGYRLDELSRHRHKPDDDDDNDDDDDEDEEDDDDDDQSSSGQPEPNPFNGQTQNGHQDVPNTNGQVDTTGESLTIADIDEVLNSNTHNNYEDSAGVIGTQEVYNDPRHRIVRERERTNADINIEKLSFQEKLKMFNLAKK